MSTDDVRIEHDTMGELTVPADALWGAQTQRAVDNFRISGLRMPRAFIRALGLIKRACAGVNAGLGLLDRRLAGAIQEASAEVADGAHDDQFPVDVFQTGSGTSTNMNANEVIARLASNRLLEAAHPNDHVNLGQSSNDVIPSAIRVAAVLEIQERLLPALERLAATIERRAGELADVAKTGRTHLMDAMPLTLGQELGAWGHQMREAAERIENGLPRLSVLPLGGTAVGTGVNAHPELGERVVALLAAETGAGFRPAANRFAPLAGQDAAVETSGQLRACAVSLLKIANDLRWMNSGPLAGLAEIELPALQPGSSIMPGKINPVIPEAVAQACVKVVGNDAAVAMAGSSGSFQLNVMLPLIAHDLLQSIGLLAASSVALADQAVAGFTVDRRRLSQALERNPVLVTALNPVIGYEKGAEIAKRAAAEGRPVLEVAIEMTDLPEDRLRELLDPVRLTRGGLPES